MRVIVTYSDRKESIFDIDSDVVVIGREDDCHIQIKSHHISRYHLEISSQQEELFIQNLSSSNWIRYDEQALEKGRVTEYCDEKVLELPEGIKVQVIEEGHFDIDESFLNKTRTVTSKLLGLSKVHKAKSIKLDTVNQGQKRNRVRAQGRQKRIEAYPHKPRKVEEEKKSPIVFIVIILAILLAYYFFVLDVRAQVSAGTEENWMRVLALL